MRLNKHLITEPMRFDGSQLRQDWARNSFDLEGESVIAFKGPYLPNSQLATLPPGGEPFEGRELLHLVVEHRHSDVEKLRLQQRLLLDVMKDKLNHRLRGDVVQRWRQDLCKGSAHLSISTILLTASTAIIYLGVMIQKTSPGSKLWGLADRRIDPQELAQAVMDQYVFEVENARQAIL